MQACLRNWPIAILAHGAGCGRFGRMGLTA